MRTNIDIDDELMKQAMAATGTRTKKAAVEAALRKLVEIREREKQADEMYRRREMARQAAEREGRLDEWVAALKSEGREPEI